MALQFINPEVAEKYEALTDTDFELGRAGVYSGKLSKITTAMAEAMVGSKSKLLRLKSPEPKTVKEVGGPLAEDTGLTTGGVKAPGKK